ncbi:MAG: NAD-dependent epimerase/dehydratase family protein [Bacteroidota bacterium]
MPEILITGADSFIGKSFRKFSKFRRVEEISLIDNKPGEIEYSGYEVVLHLAAIVHESKRIKQDDYFKVNRDLTLEVAERARKQGVKHFIFMSTVKVYGKFITGSDPWNEATLCNPDEDYGRSKYEAEQELLKLQSMDFTVSIVRTPIVYGEGVQANILKLIRLVDRIKILPFKDVRNLRYFTYSGNLIACIDRIIEKRIPGIFIAMDDIGLSTTQLVELICNALDRKVIFFKPPLFLLKIWRWMTPHLFVSLYGSLILDNSATRELLDFSPPYTPSNGISNTIAAYKQQGENEEYR